MTRRDLIRALRLLAKNRGVAFAYDERGGKGSHAKVAFGERSTSVPHGELKVGTVRAILRQLGLSPDDIR